MFLKRQPKGRIDLACPACGFVQSEPAAVFSTFCRACGEHYRVKRGKVVARPGVAPSGIVKPLATARPGEDLLPAPDSPASAPPPDRDDHWLRSAEDGEEALRSLSTPEDEEGEEGDAAIATGAFFGLGGKGGSDQSAAKESKSPADAIREGDEADSAAPEAEGRGAEAAEHGGGGSDEAPVALGRNAVGRDALGSGSFGALIEGQRTAAPSGPSQMPADYEPQEGKPSAALSAFEVRCFRCFHTQPVSRYAKSTQCARCSTYISLADYEIRARRSHTLRTRGDIVIRRRGGLRDCEIACHHLTVGGSIDARVDCSGDAVFRRGGLVRGHLYCRKLIVEKGAEVEFPDGAKAEHAEIHGRIVGDLVCGGLARVHRSGSVSGDLVAASIEIRDGGRVEGETRVDPETTIAPSPVLGYSSPVIG